MCAPLNNMIGLPCFKHYTNKILLYYSTLRFFAPVRMHVRTSFLLPGSNSIVLTYKSPFIYAMLETLPIMGSE